MLKWWGLAMVIGGLLWKGNEGLLIAGAGVFVYVTGTVGNRIAADDLEEAEWRENRPMREDRR